MSEGYEFTSDWFSLHRPIWQDLLRHFPPTRILEIGSWEGRTSCWLIDQCARHREIEVHCVDTWTGGMEHDPEVMAEVERRFDANLAKAIASAPNPVRFQKHKAASSHALPRLIAGGGARTYDLIYIDGSHQAPDVLADAIFAFQLCKVGGLLIFDDYLWNMESRTELDPLNIPKPAIDAFTNIFMRKLDVFPARLYQLYMRKIAP